MSDSAMILFALGGGAVLAVLLTYAICRCPICKWRWLGATQAMCNKCFRKLTRGEGWPEDEDDG